MWLIDSTRLALYESETDVCVGAGHASFPHQSRYGIRELSILSTLAPSTL